LAEKWDYTVKAVISNTKDGNRYYDHKLTQIEKGKLLDELTLSNATASSGLSSAASQGDTDAGRPANDSRETIESPISKYKDKRLITILQTNPQGIAEAQEKIQQTEEERTRRKTRVDTYSLPEGNTPEVRKAYVVHRGASRAAPDKQQHLRTFVNLGIIPDAERCDTNNHFFAYPITYVGKKCYVFYRALLKKKIRIGLMFMKCSLRKT